MRGRAVMICVLVLAGCGGGSFPATAPPVPAGTLFVADADGISVFSASASGNATPQRRITGLYASRPGANGGGGLGSSSTSVRAIAAGSKRGTVAAVVMRFDHGPGFSYVVDEFGPDADGAVSPQNVYPDALGTGWVAPQGIARVPGSSSYDVLQGYGFVVKTPPTNVFRTAVGQFGLNDRGIALDASGNVYVSSQTPDKVAVYAAASTCDYAYPRDPLQCDTTPLRTITAAASAGAIAIGPDGTLYVVEQAGPQGRFTIEEFAADSMSPARVLGPFAPDEAVIAIALDGQNALYVAQAQTANAALTSIAVFAPGASGAATPVRVLQNPLPNIVAIAVGP